MAKMDGIFETPPVTGALFPERPISLLIMPFLPVGENRCLPYTHQLPNGRKGMRLAEKIFAFEIRSEIEQNFADSTDYGKKVKHNGPNYSSTDGSPLGKKDTLESSPD
ncbi:hypothetical protein [Larkinella rosea]|uniref:Uncharacterized protein n=1 Tax=Larkinella rosea TaxID=2025312 RepID=A0A3P1BYY9_9BACT|nr:hypothetical protein [Larkinella rosea]RRB06320.1 hypothetical protein EHT25_00500 [Larkinella rosea]